jgi:hypothetical protein
MSAVARRRISAVELLRAVFGITVEVPLPPEIPACAPDIADRTTVVRAFINEAMRRGIAVPQAYLRELAKLQ